MRPARRMQGGGLPSRVAYCVLALLEGAGKTVRGLAVALEVSGSSAHRVLEELGALGYVTHAGSPRQCAQGPRHWAVPGIGRQLRRDFLLGKDLRGCVV